MTRWLKAAFVSVAMVFVMARWQIFTLDQTWQSTDTYSYLQVARQPLSSLDFWAGGRPFTLPLLYKALGFTSSQQIGTAVAERVAIVQFGLAILAWLSLASSVAFSLRRLPAAMITGFTVTLAFASTLDVALWDRLLISESVSSSLFALLLAGWLLILDRPGITAFNSSRWISALLFASLGLISVLYSFARDANAAVILGAATLGIAALAFRAYRRSFLGRAIARLSLVLFVVGVLQISSASRAERWLGPLLNVFHHRVLPDPERLEVFYDQGLSPNSITPEMRYSHSSFWFEVERDPNGRRLVEWFRRNGREAYLLMLIQQPVRTLGQPMLRTVDMLGGSNIEFRRPVTSSPTWVEALSSTFFPQNRWIVIAGAALSLGLLTLMRPRAYPASLITLAVLALLLTYPMAFAVWHGDAIELERHGFQVALQVRLAMWMLACAAMATALGSSWPILEGRTRKENA